MIVNASRGPSPCISLPPFLLALFIPVPFLEEELQCRFSRYFGIFLVGYCKGFFHVTLRAHCLLPPIPQPRFRQAPCLLVCQLHVSV